MSCPECADNLRRAERVDEAEQLLLLFTGMFSELSRTLMNIEVERDRRRYAENPPPEGAQPFPKRRFVLMPVNIVGGKILSEMEEQPITHANEPNSDTSS